MIAGIALHHRDRPVARSLRHFESTANANDGVVYRAPR